MSAYLPDPRVLLQRARADLATARLVHAHQVDYGIACFHLQQAAEKLLKAFLSYRGVPVPRIHDLQELLRQLPEGDIFPDPLRNRIIELTEFSTFARYEELPGLDEHVFSHAERCVAEVEERLRELLPAEFWP